MLLDGTILATDNNNFGDAGNVAISAPEEVAIVNQSNISSGGRFGAISIGAGFLLGQMGRDGFGRSA